MGQEQNQVFWQRVIASVGVSGVYAEVAARHSGSVCALRSWLYKLRKDRGGAAASPPLRLVPVTVQGEPAEAAFRLDIDAGGCRLHFAPAPIHVT